MDAYPIPQIEDIVSELSKYKVFTTINLKSTYHQIELDPGEGEYTAFQAGNELYQWRRMPFGLTNAVPEFQRALNRFIEQYNLKGCFPYLDDITIAGVNQSEHDINLKALSQTEISILGYKIGFGYIKLDPDRVQPLFDLPLPQSTKELQRMMGLFAYYARWIPSYSEKVRPLIKSQSFPLTDEAILAIKTLKDTLASATLQPIDFAQPLTVETDASEFAVAATLNQDGRAVDPVHDPEWTPSRMDTIPNGHHSEWTQSRMDTIPNGHNPEWTPSRKDTIPNG